jgi:glycosyltransferase EpsE
MPHVDDAVRSIFEQTHGDFELVIFDDGWTDGSTERLRDWAERDHRIKLTERKANLGAVGSSKAVVELASGELIARMDADDVSHPRRFERQLQVLADRPEVGLVACVCDVIGVDGEVVRGSDVWRLGRRSWFAPFAHGSAMFRREVFEAVGGYREASPSGRTMDISFDPDRVLSALAADHQQGDPECIFRHIPGKDE